ncbi:MAG TPA: hypothetical protein VKB35_09415 [Ktedonobacteraceae bacterium]|nr:hypothetical protein [Ktedonobacteraceae bacterium]
MRGKLRDKRTDSRQDRIRRELTERRRPPRRASRATILHLQRLEEEDSLLDDEDRQLVGAREQKK